MSDDIIPDDKNWTWVLEAKCSDCGFNAPAFVAKETAPALRDQVTRWIAVLHREDVRIRPHSSVWSPLEYSCHVRDVFRKFDERLALMIETDDPSFENWDQDATAVADRYDLQNPRIVSEELSAAGHALANRFDNVGESQWQRRGFRSDGSVFTIESIAKYLMHDPIHHLWDVGAEVPIYG